MKALHRVLRSPCFCISRAGMSNLYATLRLSLLALLLAAFVLGCANGILRKAEMAREEAGYLETNAVEQWAIENGKTQWDVPTVQDINPYIPEGHPVRTRSWNDPFGNPYVLNCTRQGVAVNAKTIELCSEVTKSDPPFWGHHDGRLLGLIEAAKSKDLDAVRRLVETVPDPNIPNKMGDKALVFALANGDLEMEEVLTSHGAVLDPGVGTPLLLAINNRNTNAVRDLLDRYPYMATATSISGDTDHKTYQRALCDASDIGDPEFARMLLAHGADPNTLDGFSLWVATVQGHLDVVKVLVDGGAQITPKALKRASRGDRPEIREYLESQLNRTTNGVSSSGAKTGAGK